MVSKTADRTKGGEIAQRILNAFLHSELKLETFLKDTVKTLVEEFPVECAEIRLVDDKNPELLVCKESIYVRGKSQEETMSALGVTGCKVNETFIGKAYKKGKTFVFDKKTNGHITETESVENELLNQYLGFLPSKNVKHFVAIPLFLDTRLGRQKTIGALRVINKTDSKGNLTKTGFTEEEKKFLEQTASKIAIALDNLLRIKDEEEELRIKSILEQIPTSPRLDEVMEKIQNSLCDYFDSKVSTIWGYDKQNRKLVIRHIKGLELGNVPSETLDQDSCVIGETVRKCEPIHVPDITRFGSLYKWHTIVDKLGSKQLLALPLVSIENEVTGIISLHPSDDFVVTLKDIQIVKTFAEKANYSIEYARLRWREMQLKTLVDRLAILETDKLDYFFENVVELVQMVTSAKACSLFTIDHSKRTLRLVATTDTNQRNRVGEDIYEFNDGGITVRVAIRGETMMSYDISQEKGRPMKFLEEAGGPHKAFVAVPIKDRSNRTIALLKCINKQKTEISPTEYFTPDDVELLTLIATLIANFIESGRLINQMTEMDKRRDEYLESLSHETLAPVSGIMGHVDYLIRNLDNPMVPSEKKKQKLQDILDECLLLDILVKGPRDLKEEKEQYKFEFVDVNEDVLKPCIKQLRGFADSEGLEIETIGFYNIRFKLDKAKFYQVVFNLLYNAIKYSLRGTEIVVRLLEKENDFCINFENYGIGIKKEEETKILAKYYRTKNAQMKYPTGKGLGLYIVKRICDNLGLGICVAQLDNPTIFSLFLPKLICEKEVV